VTKIKNVKKRFLHLCCERRFRPGLHCNVRSIVCMWAYVPTDSSIFISHILIKPPPNYQHIAVILCRPTLQAIEVCMSFATNDADSV